jgi:chemotaxis protein methyltransferase CheR
MTEKSKNEIVLNAKEVDHFFIEIHKRYGYDFVNYSRASINRRLIRFMINNHFAEVNDLKERLLNDPDLFEFFVEELMVNVTEMFRDPSFFKALREKVMPILSTYPHIRIWDAGCSTGEELLSLAIMLHEEKLLEKTRIYATDLNQRSLITAKNGAVPLSEINLYSNNYKDTGGKRELSYYYHENKKIAVFNPSLLSNVVFYPHNLATDTSFNEFHLILCRNVFIYFNKQLQERVLHLFLESLSPLGFLSLGKKETISLSQHAEGFSVVDNEEKIFRKIML